LDSQPSSSSFSGIEQSPVPKPLEGEKKKMVPFRVWRFCPKEQQQKELHHTTDVL
jgi:hypothetical protein